MSVRAFLDRNVFTYPHDSQAGQKQQAGARILEELRESREGVLSARR